MIQPDFHEFQRLAKRGNLIPVYDVFSADLLTPVSAYLRIAQGARYSFLLESVEGGEKIARYTFARTHRTLSSRAASWFAAAGRGRHRLFQLRHGALDRAHSQTSPRRNRSLRRDVDVLSRTRRLRPRATPLVDRSQRFHRRPRQSAHEI